MGGSQDGIITMDNAHVVTSVKKNHPDQTDSPSTPVIQKSGNVKNIETTLEACQIDSEQKSEKMGNSSDGAEGREEKSLTSKCDDLSQNNSSNTQNDGNILSHNKATVTDTSDTCTNTNDENNSNCVEKSLSAGDTQDNVQDHDKNSPSLTVSVATAGHQHGVLVVEDPQDVLSRIDIVRFLLPALCHLTVEDTPRQILLSENSQTWLVKYLLLCMEKVQHCADDTAKVLIEFVYIYIFFTSICTVKTQ